MFFHSLLYFNRKQEKSKEKVEDYEKKVEIGFMWICVDLTKSSGKTSQKLGNTPFLPLGKRLRNQLLFDLNRDRM